ncbi:UDP-forming cellulose synthase catalytic subunit [Herbaspirillum sp. C7C2]|uniref:UDP-forming cellulose synthase catalytic subunit n=1 Tax=Herbaspirillum sp. C7C2 TaxID=2736666 RepID=UPI001F521896|nr:UDP-forming cellulose synthase catalytic subunit [Herbaspirillum sp. C7C2]MCI1013779.1 UDP-forming cellulose synthase catalytic subunit [Herbaspirillum sp. C7C2]
MSQPQAQSQSRSSKASQAATAADPAAPTSNRLQTWIQTWGERLEALPRRPRRWLQLGLLLVAVLLALLLVSVPLEFYTQCIFAIGCFVAALILRKQSGRFPVLVLITLSLIVSMRYMYWRITSTLAFEDWLDIIFGYGLLAAEIYSLIVLTLGYLQTAWPLRRKPQMLTMPPSEWPTVDVFIPSYNESLDIVSLTIFAAQAIDWPQEKLRVHVLDDGRREDFREFCNNIGVNYLVRSDNKHAKAGNLNEALKVTDGEFVAIFDADHVPTRSFLQICMGWFYKDPKLAMLQTPHFFFSPDPFEKNLNTFRSVPNEGELFYGLVQDGNDLWNAAFFCGSCAVMRRTALMEIGGIAVETLTEDAHTALKMNRAGYNTAYLAIPQAAGLATENLARHIRQRVRWARGMAQIFRVDNPLRGKGLKLGQRFCYLNAMLHFFYGLPRLIFLTAPLTYLFFGAHIFHASALMITAYVLPHVLHASLTNSRIQGRFRHSFWNEVYETVLAWYILGPVLLALVNPKLGGFNVTDKGGIILDKHFDWKLARPYIVLLLLNLLGMVFGVWQLVMGDPNAMTTILINMAWTLYNVIISSAAMAVASETRQVRSEPRVAAELPVRIKLADGNEVSGTTLDFSQKGIGLRLPKGVTIARGQHINVTLFRNQQEKEFPAVVVFSRGEMVGAQFHELTLRQNSELVRLTFSRADIWANNWGKSRRDTPLKALREVSLIGVNGIKELIRATLIQLRLWRDTRRPPAAAGVKQDPVVEAAPAAPLAAATAAGAPVAAAAGAVPADVVVQAFDKSMEKQ